MTTSAPKAFYVTAAVSASLRRPTSFAPPTRQRHDCGQCLGRGRRARSRRQDYRQRVFVRECDHRQSIDHYGDACLRRHAHRRVRGLDWQRGPCDCRQAHDSNAIDHRRNEGHHSSGWRYPDPYPRRLRRGEYRLWRACDVQRGRVPNVVTDGAKRRRGHVCDDWGRNCAPRAGFRQLGQRHRWRRESGHGRHLHQRQHCDPGRWSGVCRFDYGAERRDHDRLGQRDHAGVYRGKQRDLACGHIPHVVHERLRVCS